MSSKTLFRLSGLCTLLGGVLGAVAMLLHPLDPLTPAAFVRVMPVDGPVHLVLFFGLVLLLIGFPGVYVRQSAKTGVKGLIAASLLLLAPVFIDFPHTVVESAVFPQLFAHESAATAFAMTRHIYGSTLWMVLQMCGAAMMIIGLPFFVILTVRARIFPRWPAFLLITFYVLLFASSFLPDIINGHAPALVYAGFAAYGYSLFVKSGAPTQVETGVASDTPVPAATTG